MMTTELNKVKTKFCHYTSIDNARNIINGESIYLNKLDKMNDLKEKKCHQDELQQIFILSFCHSEARSIPLFYLYSGIDGKGCRLEFTAAKIRSMLKEAVVYPVNQKGIRLKQAFDPLCYDIYADWIYYVSNDGFCSYRGTKTKAFKSFKDAKKILKEKAFFIKDYVWQYEKEFRIVIRFHEPINYNKVALKYNIQTKEKSVGIKCGPELTPIEYSDLRDEFQEYGIQNIARFTGAEIKMGLIERYKHLLK